MPTEFALLTLLMSPVAAFIFGVLMINILELWNESPSQPFYRDGH